MRSMTTTAIIILLVIASTSFAKEDYVQSSKFKVFAEHYTIYDTVDFSDTMSFSFAYNGKKIKSLWESRDFMYNFTANDIDMFLKSANKYQKWSSIALKDKDIFVKDIAKSGEFKSYFKSTGDKTFLYIKMQGPSERDYYTWRIDSNQVADFKKSLIEFKQIVATTKKTKDKYN